MSCRLLTRNELNEKDKQTSLVSKQVSKIFQDFDSVSVKKTSTTVELKQEKKYLVFLNLPQIVFRRDRVVPNNIWWFHILVNRIQDQQYPGETLEIHPIQKLKGRKREKRSKNRLLL